LRGADESKLREVVALLDDAASPAANQALLDPIRGRLGAVRLRRPLRFARLLFLPLDGVIVPARGWKPDQATVPRSVLTPVAALVHTALGAEAARLDRAIAGHALDDLDAVALAGEALWPAAGAILANAEVPSGWTEATGLPAAVFAPLAGAMAVVSRRAPLLWRMAREAEVGALRPSETLATAILANIEHESELGRAMLAQSILARAPAMATLLQRIVRGAGDVDVRVALTRAMGRGTEGLLTSLETSGPASRGGPEQLAAEVRALTSVLREVEFDPAAVRQKPRLRAIRQRLAETCRERFVEGLQTGLVAPLASAPGPVDAGRQTQLEAAARGLRALETAARKLDNPEAYDSLMRQATDTVRDAAKAGTLALVRQCRLVEILSGPDEAAALYAAGAKRGARAP